MGIVVYEMAYARKDVEDSGIACVPFEQRYFGEYRRIYNACFHEMREALGIVPYDVMDEDAPVVGEVFLLLDGDRIIGSVACRGNEIDDLIVDWAYRDRGYGKRLLLWGMDHIRRRSAEPITLHVAEWNEKAVGLYRKVGFEITKIERIEKRGR